MRDKQPPSTNLPTVEDTNQTRTVKLPVKAQDQDQVKKPTQLCEG